MACTSRRRAVIEPSMEDENSPNADKGRAAEVDPATAPSTTGADPYQIAARIAEKLRDAGFGFKTFEPEPVEEAILLSDRVAVVSALAVLTVLAWCYLLFLSADMRGMDMSGFRTIPSGIGLMVPASAPWRAMEFAFVFAMWAVMTVGMMTPSAVPMILMYARMGRHVEPKGAPLVATGWFAGGYFIVWVAFSLLATLGQWALERRGLLDAEMASTSNILGGLAFVAAGAYQWTRLKQVCLVQCQAPFAFLMRHGGFRRDAHGSVVLGLRHGAYCVGCCWVLMTLLFVGGVMNPPWILLLALLILIEKVAPPGRLIARLAGIVLVATGAWLLRMS